MRRKDEIRIGGAARSLEEEEGLQLAVTILELSRRLRGDKPALRDRALHGPLPKRP